MDTRKEIIAVLKAHKPELRKKFKVKELAIFGSLAKGTARTRSDVDILVDFVEVPDLFEFSGVKLYLEKLLHKKVDLVRKQALRKELNYVLNEAVVI